jgi:hypothetical protein
MNLTLHLPPQTEARLKEQATRMGKSPEELALEALQERLAIDSQAEASSSPASRLAEFQAWLAAHPASSTQVLDDSRESIYRGRGE